MLEALSARHLTHVVTGTPQDLYIIQAPSCYICMSQECSSECDSLKIQGAARQPEDTS